MGETIRAKFREMSATPAEQIRAPDGRFAKQPALAADALAPTEETVVDTPEEVPTEEQPPAEEPEQIEETPPVEPEAPKPGEPDISKPPSSLTAAEKAEYEKAPPVLKKAFHRREADFHKGLEAQREKAAIGELMDKEVRPYEAMIRAANLTPQLVVRDLLNTAYQLRSGTPEAKFNVVLNIARQYGVDLTNLQSRAEELAATAPPPPDPRVMELQNKLEGLTKSIEEQKTQAERAEYEAQQAEVQKFAANPANKHYEAVKLDMAALIANGRADGLQDAYNKAIWAHPAVREQLLAQQREDARKRAAEKAAVAKKAASVNVAPRGTPPAAPVVGTDMSETIRQALRKMQTG